MNSKRGLSAIIVTLIMILLGIVAAGIIWVVIANVVSTGSEQISSGLGSLAVNLEILKVLVEDNGDVKVTIKMGAGSGDLLGLNLILSDGDNSQVVEIKESLPELATKTFTITSADLTIAFVKSVSVAPILKSGSGKESLGNVVDTQVVVGGGNGGGSCPEQKVSYLSTLGPDAASADCQPNVIVLWDWGWRACGGTSGWGSNVNHADGDKSRYVSCPWTDTIPAGSTITNIFIDPIDVTHFVRGGLADWYMNNLLLLDNDNLDGLETCNAIADKPDPINLTSSGDFSNYNIGGANNISIYKQAGTWYILNGGSSGINITVSYIPLSC